MGSAVAKKKRYPSAVAVERAAEILFLLAERDFASVTELAMEARLSASAVHRILTALKRKGLVEQDPTSEKYELSWGVLALGRKLADRDQLRPIAFPFMTHLRDLSTETVTLYVRSGFERICIEQVESPQEIRYRAEVGRLHPLYAGASGHVLLAFMRPDQLEEYFTSVQLQRLTPFTLSDRKKLERELKRVRGQGYATASQDRLAGLAGIAAPVFDKFGETNAAIAIGGPDGRITSSAIDSWVEPLTEAAREISARIRGGLPAGV